MCIWYSSLEIGVKSVENDKSTHIMKNKDNIINNTLNEIQMRMRQNQDPRFQARFLNCLGWDKPLNKSSNTHTHKPPHTFAT